MQTIDVRVFRFHTWEGDKKDFELQTILVHNIACIKDCESEGNSETWMMNNQIYRCAETRKQIRNMINEVDSSVQ